MAVLEDPAQAGVFSAPRTTPQPKDQTMNPQQKVSFLEVLAFLVLLVFIGLLGSLAPVIRWLLILLLMIGFLALLGWRRHQRLDGFLIDARYKMSLSRFQLTLWTLVAFSAFFTLALDRTIGLLTKSNPGIDPLAINFPDELLLALGISTVSLAGSSFIKARKTQSETGRSLELITDEASRLSKEQRDARTNLNASLKKLEELTAQKGRLELEVQQKQQALQQAEAAGQGVDVARRNLQAAQAKLAQTEQQISQVTQDRTQAESALARTTERLKEVQKVQESKEGLLHKNETPDQADWLDLFRGEEVSNYRVIEVAKVQLFLLTVAVVLAYALLIWALLAVGGLRGVEVSLPPFSERLNALLGISHGGYLVNKSAGG